jgi:hypothetical protein
MNRTEFRRRIRTSLANLTLQSALDANAERRVKGRIQALETLPNWREKRQQAHAIRAEVIDHLEEYLARFIDKAQENGIIVHRAKDAAEAIKIILEITEDLPQRTPSPQRGKEETFVPLPGAVPRYAGYQGKCAAPLAPCPAMRGTVAKHPDEGAAQRAGG